MEKEKVIIYRRISTSGQEDKFGLDVQQKIIDNYCQDHDYEIKDSFTDIISGAKEDRIGLNDILFGDYHDIKLIIAKTDRLSRDIMIYFSFKKILAEKKINVISVQEDFGELGALAPVLEAFVVAMAEVERSMITNRTSGGRYIKASKGGYAGGKTPYGYTNRDSELVINQEESDVVRLIFDSKAEGMTLTAIANMLTDSEHFTRTGKKKWQISTVAGIIKNRKTYEGLYKYGENDWVKGNHEPIL